MGSVFLAITQGPGGFNKLSVLKVLKSELALDPEFVNMFMEEARLSARINHPNVVQTYEVGFDGTDYFIAMEYLDGQTFHGVIKHAAAADQPFSLPMYLRVLAEALSGLHHAHELADFDGNPLNVVHRDVSPQNVFVTYEGTVKILDFGIAKAQDSTLETRTGVIKGKVAYMPPEQFGGKADRRADVYAVGVMLWQALAGERLWKGMAEVEILTAVTTVGIAKPSTVAKAPVPPELEEICMRALAMDPKARYQTALDFQHDLEGYFDRAGYKVNTRDIGKSVSALFSERRKEIQKTIKDRIKEMETGKDTDRNTSQVTLPSLHINQGTLSLTGESSQSSAVKFAAAAAAAAAKEQAKGNRIRFIIIGGIAAAGLAVTAIAIGRKPDTTSPVATPSALLTTSSVSAGAATSAASAETTQLYLEATPHNAKLFLDDVSIGNPAKMEPKRDGSTHRLRAEAAGYERKDQSVSFDTASARVIIDLDRLPNAAPDRKRPVADWRRPAPATPSAVVTAVPPTVVAPVEPKPPAPTPTTPPKTPLLDNSDPWAKKP
ncbi:MAG: hypothetical protein NVSMB1_07220 [Polyangiales bacterium]